MAVESRFVVIRNGVEVQTFMDKKAADEYDKMLDMADNLSEMLANAPIDLSEEVAEELSIFFAQNREDVLIALQAKKPKPVAKTKPEVEKLVENEPVEEKEQAASAETVKVAKAAKPVKSTRAAKTVKATKKATDSVDEAS